MSSNDAIHSIPPTPTNRMSTTSMLTDEAAIFNAPSLASPTLECGGGESIITEDDKDYYYTYSLSSGGYVRAGLMSELDIDDPEPEEAPAPLPPRRAPATGWYTQPVLRTIVRMHDEGTLLPAATAFFVVLWALLMVVIWKFVPPMEGARSRPKRR